MSALDEALEGLAAVLAAEPGREDGIMAEVAVAHDVALVTARGRDLLEVLVTRSGQALLSRWVPSRRTLATRCLPIHTFPFEGDPATWLTRFTSAARSGGCGVDGPTWELTCHGHVDLPGSDEDHAVASAVRAAAEIRDVTVTPGMAYGLSRDVLRACSLLASRRTLAALVEILPTGMPELFVALAGGVGRGAPHALRALSVCAGARNPTWAAQAVAGTPMLRWLLDDPAMVPAHRAARAIDRLGRGEGARSVLTDLLDFAFPGMRRILSGLGGTAWRSLAALEGTEADRLLNPSHGWDGATALTALANFLATYHAERPRRGALDAGEAKACAEALGTWLSHVTYRRDVRGDGYGTRVLSDGRVTALMRSGAASRLGRNVTDRSGRLVGLPRDAIDVVRAAEADVRGLATIADYAVQGPCDLASVLVAAEALAFPLNRDADGWERLDRVWHEGAGRRAAAAGDVPDVRLPHVSDGPVTSDGVTLSPLLSPTDYVSEGATMRHCIGTMWERAAEGGLVAWSLTGPGAERSTASAAPDGAGGLRLEQHRTSRNGPPPDLHRRVLREHLASVSSDRVRGMRPVPLRPLIAGMADAARERLWEHRALLLHWNLHPLLTPTARRRHPSAWVAEVMGEARAKLAELDALAWHPAPERLAKVGLTTWRAVSDAPRAGLALFGIGRPQGLR